MKKVFLLLLLSTFCCCCGLAQPASEQILPEVREEETEPPQAAEPTTAPTKRPTRTKPPEPAATYTPTDKPPAVNLDSVELGGEIYAAFVMTYDPSVWRVNTEEFENQLIQIDDPYCQVYSHLPRGLPGGDMEVFTSQEKIGPYDFEVTQWRNADGGMFMAVLDMLNGENISIQVIGSDDCFNAAWEMIEFSAEHHFSGVQ